MVKSNPKDILDGWNVLQLEDHIGFVLSLVHIVVDPMSLDIAEVIVFPYFFKYDWVTRSIPLNLSSFYLDHILKIS